MKKKMTNRAYKLPEYKLNRKQYERALNNMMKKYDAWFDFHCTGIFRTDHTPNVADVVIR